MRHVVMRRGIFSADTPMESACRDLQAELRRAHARIESLERQLAEERAGRGGRMARNRTAGGRR